MSRRTWIVVGVVVVLVATGVFLLVRGSGDDQQAAVSDALGEALGYVPASTDVVAALEVQRGSPQGTALRDLARDFPAARFGADAVRAGVRSLGFDADADLPSLIGGPVVIGAPAAAFGTLGGQAAAMRLDLQPLLRAGAIIAVVGRSVDDVQATLDRATSDGRLTKLGDVAPGVAQYRLPNAVGVLAARDADVVLAADAARLKAAVMLQQRGAGLTRAVFEQRLGPLKAPPALVRAVTQPRALIGARAQNVPWVDALRGGAIAVRLAKPGVRLGVHLATDPARLKPTDLPLAPGAAPPRPAPGARPISAGVRGLSQTIHVLDAAKGGLRLPFLNQVDSALRELDAVKGPLKTFGRIDVDAALIDQLTGTTTITPEAGNTIALRGELRDGGPLRTALDHIAAVPDFALTLANVDLNVRKAGDAYEITRNGTTFLKAAVIGTTLVVTNDLNASLRAIAARTPETTAARGALAFHADGPAIQDQLVQRLGLPGLARLVLGGIGDLDGSGRAELTGVDLDATLALNR